MDLCLWTMSTALDGKDGCGEAVLTTLTTMDALTMMMLEFNVHQVTLELGSFNRAISLGVERILFSVESTGLYFWRMRTSFLVECLVRVLNRRVAVAKDASPWQKQALNKLDASSMETTHIREPQGPLVASSLRSERYSPGPLRLSNARSFLDSKSNLYL